MKSYEQKFNLKEVNISSKISDEVKNILDDKNTNMVMAVTHIMNSIVDGMKKSKFIKSDKDNKTRFRSNMENLIKRLL